MRKSEHGLDDSIGFHLGRVTMRLKSALRKRFIESGHDVTPEQWAVLWRLWEEEGITQSEIAERTIKDRTTITRILDGLEKRNLITRRRDEADRRSFRIFLTDEGRSLEHELVPLSLEIRERAFGHLSPEERERFIQVLDTIYDKIS